jgi:hypothetical protein
MNRSRSPRREDKSPDPQQLEFMLRIIHQLHFDDWSVYVKGSDTIHDVKTKIHQKYEVGTDRELFLQLMLTDGSCERLDLNKHTLNQLGIHKLSDIWVIDVQALD